MSIIFFRATILLITLTVVMRLMGKRQIGEMQPFEFIITLLIAELACIPMSDVSIPLVYGIVSVLAVFIIHQLLTIISRKSNLMRRLACGKPSVVIDRYGVDLKELKRNNMGVDDLIESLRTSGNFALDTVLYAIYESNGKLSVLKDETAENEYLPLLIVNDGQIEKKNLSVTGLSYEFIDKIMNENDVKKLKDIEVLTLDGSGKVYLQTKNESYRTFKTSLPEGCAW